MLKYVVNVLARARCWCDGAENPLFRKATVYEPGAGASSKRMWVSTEQPCERARARAGSREEEKRGLVVGSNRGAWSTWAGGGTCLRGLDVALVLREARARATAVGPRWRNREPAPSVVVLANEVVVVEEVQSSCSPSASACAAGVLPANAVRSMATPPRACVLDGRRARARLERAGMPRRRMAAPVRDAGSVPRIAAAGASQASSTPYLARVPAWPRRACSRARSGGGGTCSRGHKMFDEMKRQQLL